MESIEVRETQTGMAFDPKYPVATVAKFLSVSKQTVYRLIDSRKLGTYRVGGQIRVGRSHIEAFLEENSVFVEKTLNESGWGVLALDA